MGCTAKDHVDSCPGTEACGYTEVLGDGTICDYSVKQYETWDEYTITQSAKNLFQQVLADIEKEAQAKYNAKLTKEQNVCINNENNKGIMGASENGSTFMWVKLNSNKVPKNYAMKGLTTNQFKASNDLYGSFCRARITVTSDDKEIQDALNDKATAYFAVGDSFTCGSWIDQKTLDAITKKVGEQARKDAGEGSTKEKLTYAWSTIGGFLGGGALGTGLTESGVVSGLLNKADYKMTNNKSQEDYKKICYDYIEKARSAVSSNNIDSANSYASSALATCEKLGAKDCPKEDVDGNVINNNKAVSLSSSTVTTTNNANEFKSSLEGMKGGVEAFVGKNDAGKKDSDYTRFSSLISEALKLSDVTASNNFAEDAKAACLALSAKNTYGLRSTYCTYKPWVNNSNAASSFTTTQNVVANKTDFNDYLARIETACRNANDLSEAEAKRNKAARIAIPIATSVAGGALGAGISASVLQAKYETAANEAVKAWMDEIGSHIQCYLGSEELGSYGDVISFEID